jgi:hypothetical protein
MRELHGALMLEAADEIERLRALLPERARYPRLTREEFNRVWNEVMAKYGDGSLPPWCEDNAVYLREWAADIRKHSGKSVDADRLNRIADEIERLRAMDIVEWLRRDENHMTWMKKRLLEAADEIERLRAIDKRLDRIETLIRRNGS